MEGWGRAMVWVSIGIRQYVCPDTFLLGKGGVGRTRHIEDMFPIWGPARRRSRATPRPKTWQRSRNQGNNMHVVGIPREERDGIRQVSQYTSRSSVNRAAQSGKMGVVQSTDSRKLLSRTRDGCGTASAPSWIRIAASRALGGVASRAALSMQCLPEVTQGLLVVVLSEFRWGRGREGADLVLVDGFVKVAPLQLLIGEVCRRCPLVSLKPLQSHDGGQQGCMGGGRLTLDRLVVEERVGGPGSFGIVLCVHVPEVDAAVATYLKQMRKGGGNSDRARKRGCFTGGTALAIP